MKKNHLRHGLAALGAVIALVMFAASPASAATVSISGNITGGSLDVTKPGQPTRNIPLATGTSGCAGGTISADVDTSANTITVTDVTNTGRFTFGPSGDFIADLILLSSTAGTWNSPSGTVSNVDVVLGATIYNAVGATGCTKGTKVCDWAVGVLLDGSFTGTGLATGDVYTLSGSDYTGLQPNNTCGTPFSAYNNGNVTANALTLQLI